MQIEIFERILKRKTSDETSMKKQPLGTVTLTFKSIRVRCAAIVINTLHLRCGRQLRHIEPNSGLTANVIFRLCTHNTI